MIFFHTAIFHAFFCKCVFHVVRKVPTETCSYWNRCTETRQSIPALKARFHEMAYWLSLIKLVYSLLDKETSVFLHDVMKQKKKTDFTHKYLGCIVQCIQDFRIDCKDRIVRGRGCGCDCGCWLGPA